MQTQGYEIRVRSAVPVPADIPPARRPTCSCTVVLPDRVQARLQNASSLVMRRNLVFRGILPPRPPDDQLRRPRRRVCSPSRGASQVDVIVGPERTRHIVTVLFGGPQYCGALSNNMPPGETTCNGVTRGFSSDYLQGRSGHGRENVERSVGFYGTGLWVTLE